MAEVAAMEPAGQKSRFATINEEQLNKILTEKDAKNTKRATDSSIRTFKSYLREKNYDEDFEDLPNEQLDAILKKFYSEVRTENGELYKKSSLTSLRHGINRYLSNQPSGKDIIHGKDFTESNKVFSAVGKDLKRQGKGGVTHYPPIEIPDLQKMYEYFDVDNNVKLQQKVFVDIMLYFGRRGRENIHELKITDFAATSDSNGRLYIYMVKDELTKNHQDNENTADGHMYARDDEMCPVRSFHKYAKHLRGNKCDRLFQRPSTKANSLKWYDSVPMGHNTIGILMPLISESAGLSRRYTNHSLRATSVNVLDNIGNFSSRNIMSVTGHKSEQSLKTYSGYTGKDIKRQMSDTISSTLRPNTSGNPKKVRISEPIDNKFEIQPLTNAEFGDLVQDLQNDGFDEILLSIDLPTFNKENQPGPSSNSTVFNSTVENRYNGTLNYMVPIQPQLQLPVFKNCSNITINYNLK